MSLETIYSQFKPVNSQVIQAKTPTTTNIVSNNNLQNDIFEKKDNTKKYLAIFSGIIAAGLAIYAIIRYHKSANHISDKTLNITPKVETEIASEIKPAIQHIPKTNNPIITPEIAIERLNQLKKEYNPISWLKMQPETGYAGVGQNICCIQEKIYDKLRRANYPKEGFLDIASLTQKATEQIRVDIQKGWHYRTPISFQLKNNEQCIERISLNVKPDKQLIEQLDKYFAEHVDEVRGYYKTPNSFEGWSERHDPITIYLHRSAKGTSVLDDIAKIAKPYVRSTGNSVLLGKKYADGCAWQLSPQRQHIEELAGRIEEIFGYKASLKLLRQKKFSAGEVCAYNEVLNKIRGENIEVLIP